MHGSLKSLLPFVIDTVKLLPAWEKLKVVLSSLLSAHSCGNEDLIPSFDLFWEENRSYEKERPQ